MARFRYRMQNILNIKESMEQQAKMQYAEANRRLREEEERLSKLRRRKVGYEVRARKLLSDQLDIYEIAFTNQAIKQADEDVKMQQVQVHTAQINVDRARQRMTEVMQERKTHEKLKEKAFEEFLVEEKHKESKEIDELTSYTYGQKLVDNENKEKDQAV